MCRSESERLVLFFEADTFRAAWAQTVFMIQRKEKNGMRGNNGMNNQNVHSNQTEHELDPSKLLSVFRIYWGWILMVVILATTAAVIYTSVFANKIWSTSVQFYVWMNSFDSTDTQTQQITTSQFSAAEKHAQSAIEILKTKTFRKDVIGISELSGGHDVLKQFP